MTHAIIFDADGMVIKITEFCSDRLIKDHGCNPESVQDFFVHEFQDCVIGKADLKESLKSQLPKWGWQGTVNSLINEWFTFEDQLNKPLVKIIKQLKTQNIRCYLATNQEKYRAQYLADKMGFLKLFDYLFFSHEMHCKKPQEKFFKYIKDSLSYMEGFDNKENIMFWDDREDNVKAANKFGFNSQIFKSNKQFIRTLEQNEIYI